MVEAFRNAVAGKTQYFARAADIGIPQARIGLEEIECRSAMIDRVDCTPQFLVARLVEAEPPLSAVARSREHLPTRLRSNNSERRLIIQISNPR
jgi:hypothetical protein